MMDSQCCLSLLCTILIPLVLSLWIYRNKLKHQTRILPPGPRKLPLLGNLHQLGSLPHRSLARLSQQYGPIMFLKLGSIPTIVISSHDVAREVFKDHDRVFSGRAVLHASKKLSYNCSNITFSSYGDTWRELRKIAMLELLSAKRVQSFRAVREEEIMLLLDAIAAASGSSELVNLSELMTLLANTIVCRIIFGNKSFAGDANGRSRFQEALYENQSILGGFCVADLFPWMSWFNKLNGFDARIDNNFRELDNLYDEILQEHKDPRRPIPEHEDLVDVLLRLQKDPSQGIAISDNQLKGEIAEMFNAGTDTSASILVWIMTELIRDLPVMKKAQDEVREVAKGKLMVEESDLSKLVYLKAVIKEVLRLHPPVPLLIPRETIEDCKINGYDIPAKTAVFVNAFAIATDLQCCENPQKFVPERFLNSSIDFRGQEFELIPFGAGRRGCPGINFAVVLIELTVANLLYRFDWKLPRGMRVEDIDVEEEFGLTTHKKNPLCLVAISVNPLQGRYLEHKVIRAR